MTRSPRLLAIVERLDEVLGKPDAPEVTDPFEQILFEQVAYLTTDEKRAAAFEALRNRIGLDPESILEAEESELLEIASIGGAGIAKERVSRMRKSARIVLKDWDGNLSDVLGLPFAKARRVLQAFAMIGEPGADKILLFSGASNRLALESNGLRVLLRIGYGSEESDYRKSYRSVIEEAGNDLDDRWETAYEAHVQLKRLGREVCRRSDPRCEACPLNDLCSYYAHYARRKG